MAKIDLETCVLEEVRCWNAFATETIMKRCGGSAEQVNRILLNSSEWSCQGMFDIHSQYLIWERTTVASTSFGPDYGEREQPALTETSAIELLKSFGYKIYKEL